MAATAENTSRNWGLIAGNGDFPFLVLEGARSRGIEMAVIAIREEASPALERAAKRLHWVSLGELSRGIELLHQEGVKHAVMAGQVKHNKIFSSIRPDWRLAKLAFFAAREKYGLADRRRRSRAGRRRNRAGGFDEISRAAAAGDRRADAPRAGRSRSRRHRLRPADRPANRGARSGPDSGGPRPRLRGHRGHGRHRRDHRARRAHRRRPAAGGRESEQAAQDMRFDVPVMGMQDHRSDAPRERHRAGDRCGPHAAFRPRSTDSRGRRRRHRHPGVCAGDAERDQAKAKS